MADREFTLYEWIEAALQIGKPCCEIHKKTRLQLVWLVDENDNLIDWYIECPNPKCNREYLFLMSFHLRVIPDET